MRRRRFLQALAVGAALTSVARAEPILTRPIGAGGEQIPAVGLGTYQAFDVTGAAEPQREVLRSFLELGGKLVDSSPMYGRAEAVVGRLARELKVKPFWATKVWTRGGQAGLEQMRRSQELMGPIDLMQVHNLLDLGTHMATLKAWKAEGRLRYTGVTHYRASAHAELEGVLKKHRPDFLQINYSVAEPEAAQRLLPLARDLGVAVIVNRPLGGGALIRRLAARPLPEWAAEAGCDSWAQMLLKYCLANPAVTCVIPATSKPRHLRDNMGAGFGKLPDERWRRRIVSACS